MALGPGTRLGPYEITAQIGAGGMGRVYRARDTNLDREVAIKVLPEAVASDPERLARFDREAKTLAALNHPGIAAIYGLERSDGQTALVMELVEGPTLAERIAQGAIPVDEALPIARQIAEALEAAHEQGIVHRDLKPANIKVRPDGTVKVLDFGLAKALGQDGARATAGTQSMSPTITTPAMTAAGIILGTAAYMSPEQAKGRVADRRSDVWAFGCVLYEMLAACQPFAGGEVSEVLAAVIRADPDWTLLPGELSPRLVELLRRCLQKDARQRYHDMADVRLDLEQVLADAGGARAGQATEPARVSSRALLPWVLATVALLLAVAGWTLRPSSVAHPVVRLSYVLPADQTPTQQTRPHLAISRDGQRIVYVANQRLYRRDLSDETARPIPGTDTDPSTPLFSPDGEWIAYWSAATGQLQKISVDGGLPVPLTPAENPHGASWGEGDLIVYGQPDGIWQVRGSGGAATRILEAGENETISNPQLLPGGVRVLFTALDRTRVGIGRTSAIVSRSLATVVASLAQNGARQVVRPGTFGARYLPSGHVVLAAADGTLSVAPFEAQTGTLSGEPVPLVGGVGTTMGVITDPASANYDVSGNGTLVFLTSGFSGIQNNVPAMPVVVDAAGAIERSLDVTGMPVGIRLSPDGHLLALNRNNRGLVVDLRSGNESDHPGGFHAWLASGRELVTSGTQAIVRSSLDGLHQPETIFESRDVVVATDASKDGLLVFHEVNAQQGDRDLWTLDLNTEKATPTKLLATRANERAARFSPDGRWIAYVSDESGRDEVWLMSPDPGGPRHQVTTGGGLAPVWAPSRHELYYLAPDGTLGAAAIETDPSFRRGDTRTLFKVADRFLIPGTATFEAPYDVHPDGEHFVFFVQPKQPDEATGPEQIHVVVNWAEEVARRVLAN